eukprot:590460-Ditylum_brightwellii.AAC.1
MICESEMKNMLQLLRSISTAVSEIHDAGVNHNDLISDNIIVVQNNDNTSVKIIDFGSASPQTGIKEKNSGNSHDLIALGSIFYEIFTGRCPLQKRCSENSTSAEKSDKSVIFLPQNELISTLTARVPLTIAKLTLKLMNAEGSEHFFQSARDVDRELQST